MATVTDIEKVINQLNQGCCKYKSAIIAGLLRKVERDYGKKEAQNIITNLKLDECGWCTNTLTKVSE